MPSAETKRRRIDNAPVVKQPPTHSHIFAPYRSLGHVTSSTPFTLLSQGCTFQLTTALANTVQTYDVRKLNLLFVSSPPTPGLIRRILAYRDVVYAAFDDASLGVGVWIFKRGRKIGTLQQPAGKWAGWKNLMVFGDWVVGAMDGGLLVWKRETGEVWTEIEMGGPAGAITASVHPSAVLNKVCVSRRNGDVEIWNVRTSKKIYTILSPLPFSTTGMVPGVTALVQTPAVSVIAIGYSTGEIHLHNIITDTPLFTLNATTSGQRVTAAHQRRVASLSFCTDPMVGAGEKSRVEGGARVLAVGDDDGHVTLWNLKKRTVAAVMWNAHAESSQGITVEWLAGQSVLVTSGADNSVKKWVFDSPQTTLPRLLRSRAGHSQAISALEFVSPTSYFVLSASADQSLRAQSLRNDSQSFEFSQGTEVKKATKAAKYGAKSAEGAKAGPVTCIATCPGDGREWEGILTGHQGERAARCWSFRNKKVGRWLLETSDGSQVKAVAVSSCGTFGFVGSSGGAVDMYNLQSGMHRRRFPEALTPAQARKVRTGEAVGKLAMAGKGKHTKAITGIATDSLNRVVITTGLDGKIKFWEFTTGILIHEINWAGEGAVTKMRLHRPNELLAVSCDDLCIRVVDIETKKVVRELWGCGGNITDFTFSDAGRWIVAAAMDGVVRVWDLPTGHMVDGMRTKSIVTALAFSGNAEFLATTHVDSVGINLWTNRTLFRHVPTRHLTDEDIVDLTMPTSSGDCGTNYIETALLTDGNDEDTTADVTVYNTADQLSDKMLTMSLVPRTRWLTLLNLEVVRQRNKPETVPKLPEKAPFFLPALGSATPTPQETGDTALTTLDKSRIRKLDHTNGESGFSKLLREEDHLGLVDTLRGLPPSAADLEIRSLEPEEMIVFTEALTHRLRTRRDFELVQTWMAVFLRCHGETIVSESAERLKEALEEWRAEQKREAGRLSERVGYCKGLAGFLRSGR